MSYFSYGAPAGSTDPTQGVVVSYITMEGMYDVPIMSDDGTEYLCTERTITVRGVINGSLLPAAFVGESPSTTLYRVRHTLESPRLQLFFYHNNSNDAFALCQSPAAGLGVDVRYGPVPKNVNVTKIAGSECLHVQLTYVTWVLDCTGTLPYISHRWTESVKLDETFHTTKTRTGKIIVRADIGSNPDQLRGVVAPPLDPGFLRKSSEYILQSDGLALMYTFVDEEQDVMPPLGAAKADGEYTESTADGGARWGECRVRLVGPKTGTFSDKAGLMATAIQLVLQKLDLGGLKRSNEGTWLAIGGVRESLWSNEVEIRFRTIIQPTRTSKTKGTAVDLSRFNAPLIGVDYLSQAPGVDPGTRGTANLSLIANALNDPCLSQSVLRSGGQTTLKAGQSVDSDTATLGTTLPATVKLTAVLPDDTTAYDSSDVNGVYSDYRMKTRYVPDDQIVVLSTAKSGAPAAAVQLGQGTMTAVMEWSAERYNTVPKVPTPYSNDPNLVYLRGEFDPEEIDFAADGTTPIYKVSGRYYYSFLDRTKATLNFPVAPWVDAGVAASLTAISPTLLTQLPAQQNTQGTNVLTSGAPA